MSLPESEAARWPFRLRELCRQLSAGPDLTSQTEIRREIWTIVSLAVQRYAEAQRARCSGLTREDLEDLVSEKSLDLVRRIESGRWSLEERTGPEIAGFLATAARNAVIDWLRRPHRRRHVDESVLDTCADAWGEHPSTSASADAPLQRREFITALRSCAGELQPRVRRVWFFRVFYGLASKEIAAHPEVRLKPARVDELLHGLRQSIRLCMEAKGQRLRQLPTGTFFEIWSSLRELQVEEVPSNVSPDAGLIIERQPELTPR